MKSVSIAVAVTAALLALPEVAGAGGLRGSPASMKEQHAVAVQRDLAFIEDAAEVRRLVEEGGLDTVESTADYRLSGVSFPYALPEVKLFIQRLGQQYREANGEQLVITSLTRPTANQPRNAHQLSVHPAGMAVDFRVPQDGKARAWLESVLLQLENRGLLDVTRERYPPHYHVAVFPAAYGAYAKNLAAREELEAPPAPQPAAPVMTAAVVPSIVAPASPAESRSAPPALLLLVIGMSAIAFATLMARHYTELLA
jgi:hypothetical protein